MFYDAQRDVFYFPNPYPDEWVFDEAEMEYGPSNKASVGIAST